ncbi:MAG: isochorismatase family protein [Kofleriaceae bacterium]|nr:isochorismatase family protein [Kofleriaceae bacterium]
MSFVEVEYVRRREKLLRARTALLVIDIQERLVPAMPPQVAASVLKNTQLLIAAATKLYLPIVVSQQYPKGLGQTVPELQSALGDASAAGVPVHRFDKTVFSCAKSDEFWRCEATERTSALMTREQWIVTGMEAHVCVFQTVRDLIPAATAVHVMSDAVASRTKANWRTGLELARDAGAVISSTEVAIFDLLGEAGTDEFKALSKLLK